MNYANIPCEKDQQVAMLNDYIKHLKELMEIASDKTYYAIEEALHQAEMDLMHLQLFD